MKSTQLLLSLINTISEQRTFEADNTTASQLYRNICDILMDKITTEQQELIFALNDMVGIMLGKMFDDGIITGMELNNTMQTVINEPETVYFGIMNDFSTNNFDYQKTKALIKKYRNAYV